MEAIEANEANKKDMNIKMNSEFFILLGLKSKKEIIDWCMDKGLITKEYFCPKCDQRMILKECKDVGDGYVWICRTKIDNAHYVKRSLRRGSWFSLSNMSLAKILRLTYYWSIKTPSIIIMYELGISEHTVTDWKNFCREICVQICVKNPDILGGEGRVVEIEESKLSKAKYSYNRQVKGKWVFGGVERESGKCFVHVVENRDRDTLLAIVKKYVRPGTTIISKCWKAYDCLAHEGFNHLTVDHSISFVDPETGAHTNTMKSIWSSIKRYLSQYRNIGNSFDGYLAEYVWRRRYDHRIDILKDFFNAIKELYPLDTRDVSSNV